MAVISNGTTMLDSGSISAAKGSLTLIKTLTASSSASLSFVNGADSVVLDGTYKEYRWEFVDIHPATNGAHFTVGFRDGGSNYDATKTTTMFRAYHSETDDAKAVAYDDGHDLGQSTDFQKLAYGVGNGNDESTSGFMHLYDPADTTFVKQFMAESNLYYEADYTIHHFTAGYCNVTAAIDAVQFKFSSGNIDAGTIKMYGVT
tara:strand:- start:605 stop:1213 length:609 start_codon:yes stop_codon:yes gene_type:complete